MAFIWNLPWKLPFGTGAPKKRVAIQIMSDLHLEVGAGEQYADFAVPRKAPYLLLGGDVGNLSNYEAYLAFLRRMTDIFDRVFLVLGNHDFFNQTHAAGLAAARRLEAEPALGGRLTLLQQDRFDLPGTAVTLLGCTLWTHVPDEAAAIVRATVQDYKHMKDWSVEAHNRCHTEDLAWLQAQVADVRREAGETGAAPRTIVVATHHAPAKANTSKPQHRDNPWHSGFSTEVLGAGDWRPVQYWVFGHTHYCNSFKTRGVKVVSNQRGYYLPRKEGGSVNLENLDPKHMFAVEKVIEVEYD